MSKETDIRLLYRVAVLSGPTLGWVAHVAATANAGAGVLMLLGSVCIVFCGAVLLTADDKDHTA